MIDLKARARLQERQYSKNLINGMRDTISSSLKSGNPNEEVLKLVVKREESVEELTTLKKLGDALAMIYKRIPSPVNLPRIFQITGRVKAEITNTPKVITDNRDIIQALKPIEQRLQAMATAISMIAVQKPPSYPEIKIPKVNFDDVIEAIHGIEVGGSGSNEDVISGLDRVYEAIATLANRPNMTTAPATNMSINSLGGNFHTTTLNIGTSPTALPTTAQVNRRTLLIYNNSANTIYLGDNNVAIAGVGQGLPIPGTSYSPSFQAGSTMTIYGIAAAISSVTILEMSDINTGR